jgi:CheY-like chemotaxis protein
MFPLRILIVDDAPLACEMVAAMLIEDGHFPRTALRAAEGLKKFDSESFDLVLADHQMPGMRGDRFAAMIKRRLRPKPVILMAGRVPRQWPKSVDWILRKPVSLMHLRQALNEIALYP